MRPLYSLLAFVTDRLRISWMIKLKILIGISLLASKPAFSQTKVFPNQKGAEDVLNLDVELDEDMMPLCYEVVVFQKGSFTPPQFVGGQQAIDHFVKKHVIYPENAIANKIEGDVLVNVTVDIHGKISNPIILKGLESDLDQEALRLVRKMPRLKPATENHKTKPTNTTLIIHFELPEILSHK